MARRPTLAALPHSAAVAIDGPQVRERRKLSGKTVRDLAENCGISVQYLSMIERGERSQVSAPVFARICDGLGIADRRELLRSAVV